MVTCVGDYVNVSLTAFEQNLRSIDSTCVYTVAVSEMGWGEVHRTHVTLASPRTL
ncbi:MULTISPECIES: hypothetical protein [unclassified Nostoc]|uniref:hypothetical protein n=1 Tax=unclassified Nostoc TaxID=2593658 RepID=UPI002AD1E1D4|nr:MULTISPECIES: hypothetical protein [unclassified Nostoc]MDZ8120714.1 hypothetical protein [Nostoc sp. CmiVER01]MDZ8226298.1 hypothetical protein [Nostoc sp. ChiVER01]